jgi:hypothetical protein
MIDQTHVQAPAPGRTGQRARRSPRRIVLHSPVWVRQIQVAEGYGPFRDFSSGTSEKDRKVNDMITGRFKGEGPAAHWVVMETGLGQLVGVCGYFQRSLTYEVLPTPEPSVLQTTITIPNAAYIHVIAIRECFRGMMLPEGTRLGSFLLNGAQSFIKRGWGGSMPWTWAYVDQHNRPSHCLFSAHDFGYIPPQTPGEDCKRVWSPTQRFAAFPHSPPPWEHPLAA